MRAGLRLAVMEQQVALMAAISIKLERRSQTGGFSLVGSGSAVQPGEALRVSLTSVQHIPFTDNTRFLLRDAEGYVFGDWRVEENFAGTAWVDFSAPTAEGRYSISADSPKLGGREFAQVEFIVSEQALPVTDTSTPSFFEKFSKDLSKAAKEVTLGLLPLALLVGGGLLAFVLITRRK